eukprot:scaffold151681_cov47-Prasinocladus_malaysianus.AAC.3
MSRRSPTYEMRLAKYAGRGFEVVVPVLDRARVDPMLMEKPWKHVQGLGKLLLLEKLRTPEARFRYKEQQRSRQMQRLYTSTFARRFQFRSMMHSPYNAGRMETVRAGSDASDYSTVHFRGLDFHMNKFGRLLAFSVRRCNNICDDPAVSGLPALGPWIYRCEVCSSDEGEGCSAEQQVPQQGPQLQAPPMLHWDRSRGVKLLTSHECVIVSDTIKTIRLFNRSHGPIPTIKKCIHMSQRQARIIVLKDCSPKDPPIPSDADPEELAGFVRGELTFIEDNPGRQMIGSFHPIDDDDWAKGAFFTAEAGELCYATAANDHQKVTETLGLEGANVNVTDYCGRTPLHIAALGGCYDAAQVSTTSMMPSVVHSLSSDPSSIPLIIVVAFLSTKRLYSNEEMLRLYHSISAANGFVLCIAA